jgi:hypothetical protein
MVFAIQHQLDAILALWTHLNLILISQQNSTPPTCVPSLKSCMLTGLCVTLLDGRYLLNMLLSYHFLECAFSFSFKSCFADQMTGLIISPIAPSPLLPCTYPWKLMCFIIYPLNIFWSCYCNLTFYTMFIQYACVCAHLLIVPQSLGDNHVLSRLQLGNDQAIDLKPTNI